MTVTLPLWVLLLLGGALALLLLLLWSVKHRRRPPLRLAGGQGTGIAELATPIAGLTQGTMCRGNRIELVEDEAFFTRLFADLAAAQQTIHVESFLAHEGEVTRQLAAALAGKAEQGVRVRLMLDASGGRRFGKLPLRRMREAGVDVRFYHAPRPSTLGRLNNRDHRKIAVLDGRIGWVGGHCLADTWRHAVDGKPTFRDLSARVEGPVVAQLQAAFSENWVEETGELLTGEGTFPRLAAAGDSAAHVVWLSPAGSPSSVEALCFLAIAAARRCITLQNPYFLPDPELRQALVDAVRRGVAVRVMIPAADASDAPFVQHAGHHHYGTVLAGGVAIYEYQRTLLHQKVITVDGRWSAIGSANFDDRSFEINDEVMLAVDDETVARQLEEIFARDLEHAVRIDPEQWPRRPWLHKLRDFASFLVNEQL